MKFLQIESDFEFINQKHQKDFRRALKYLRKSWVFQKMIRINLELSNDILQEVYLASLESTRKNKYLDLRLLLFEIRRKYAEWTGYEKTIHADSAEWAYRAYKEEYFPRRARYYRSLPIYFPESLYTFIGKTGMTRGEFTRFCINEFYKNENVYQLKNKSNFFKDKRRKGTVKIDLETYFKLLILKRKNPKISPNIIVLSVVDKILIENIHKNLNLEVS